MVVPAHLGNVKKTLVVFGIYIRDYTTQLYRDYNEPWQGPTSIMESKRVFFVAHLVLMVPIKKGLGFQPTKRFQNIDVRSVKIPRSGCLALSLTIWSLVNQQIFQVLVKGGRSEQPQLRDLLTIVIHDLLSGIWP